MSNKVGKSHYEGYPRLYEKINVEVEDDECSIYETFVYAMVAKGRGEPNENYYNVIKQGFKDWKLPMKSLVKSRKESMKSSYGSSKWINFYSENL